MRVGILTRRYGATHRSHMLEAVALLSGWGVKVDLIHPDERVIPLADVGVEHDLYVLKEKTELALGLAGSLHTAGAAILNPLPVSLKLRDKVTTFQILLGAGVPVPETFVAAEPSQLAPLLDAGPLVVKPHRGSRGEGIRVVREPDDLEEEPPPGPIFAQRFHEPDGRDHKIYVIGGEVFGVRRVWPARTYAAKVGEAFDVGAAMGEIALRCGAAFGIDLYGVDIVVSGGRPIVVDASSLPGFKGVPDAGRRLAEYIYAAGERVLCGEPLLPSATRAALPISLRRRTPGAAVGAPGGGPRPS